MNYREFNDNELIDYIYENNEEANEIIYDKYKPLIITMAKKLIVYCDNIGIEINDLVQEGMIGLNNAINKYDVKKNISFYTFATTCIERQMFTLIKTSKRQKHKILNESLSFEFENGNDTNLEYFFGDDEYNPENILLGIEEKNFLMKQIEKDLTNLEQQVFELKMNGFDYKEIASIIDKDPKSVDNAIQRIKIKIKKILECNK